MNSTKAYATMKAVEYCLPRRTLTNEELASDFPRWTVEEIRAKTGIASRHLADRGEWASDLAVQAAQKLIATEVCDPREVDFLLVCTQSPDYLLPSTACLIQQRLDLPSSIGAFDINLGCSGYVYSLSVAKGLIETGQARKVLLLTCETYSKFMDSGDFNVRALFGDGASATLIEAESDPLGSEESWIGPFVFGTDGRGAENLILRRGGVRHMQDSCAPPGDANVDSRHDPLTLHMNGPEIFTFALKSVPECISRLLQKSNTTMEDVDWFVFHQANAFMLEHLRKKLQIPSEKFVYALEDCGNTTSSSIPIGLCHAVADGRLRHGDRIMLVGFGVGYSWSAGLLRWFQTNGVSSKMG